MYTNSDDEAVPAQTEDSSLWAFTGCLSSTDLMLQSADTR